VKVFVTGIYAVGKTTLARSMARERGLPYVSFDALLEQEAGAGLSGAAERVLSRLPEAFVCDAIPFDVVEPLFRRTIWGAFERYCLQRDCEVIVKLAEKGVWEARGKPGRVFDPNDWESFHLGQLPDISHVRAPRRFFGDHGEISRGHAIDLLDYKGMILRRAASVPSGYDWKYQDAPELGVSGYSESQRTWENLQPALRDMGGASGKSFVDAGANHGYFSFRLEDQGATCVGLDDHSDALVTAKAIGFLRGSSVRFVGWNAKTDAFPAADCTLVLNALHHFGHSCLDRVRSRWLLLELDSGQLQHVEARFGIVGRYPSHRRGRGIDRQIVLAKRDS
jgi:hypothetical protein